MKHDIRAQTRVDPELQLYETLRAANNFPGKPQGSFRMRTLCYNSLLAQATCAGETLSGTLLSADW